MSLAGHLWTIGALARRTLVPPQAPASEPWSARFVDSVSGEVRLVGRLARTEDSNNLVILVHGLGGSSESGYLASAAAAAQRSGLSSLRLNLRGANGEGGDFYHGGLTDDLHVAVENLGGEGFERIFVLGFSLGGHVALRFATEVDNPNVAAIAAVCSPLDLAAGADAIDRAPMAIYRTYILRKLLANYRETARQGGVPTPAEQLREVRTLRAWDSRTVVPRFGFEDAADYYARASVGSRLRELRRPCLLVASEDDPMIPPSTILPSLEAAGDDPTVKRLLTVRWLQSGGHLGFSSRLDLGLDGPLGLENQLLSWLQRTVPPVPQSLSSTSRTQQ